jgi:hypothetical protein
MTLLGCCWGTVGVLLGHCWGTVGALLGYWWGTVGVLLGHCWSTVGVLLGYCWGTVPAYTANEDGTDKRKNAMFPHSYTNHNISQSGQQPKIITETHQYIKFEGQVAQKSYFAHKSSLKIFSVSHVQTE